MVPSLTDTLPAPRVPTKTSEGEVSRVPGKFWLTWNVGPSPTANDADAKISLRASNNNKDPVYLNAISFTVKTGARGGALFAAETFQALKKDTQSAPTDKAGVIPKLPVDGTAPNKSAESTSTAGSTTSSKPDVAPAASGGPAASGAPEPPKRSSKVNEVELVQSVGSPARRLEFNMIEAGKGFNKWVIKVVMDTEKFISITPGGWIELVFNGRVNGASSYEIDVDEDWKDAKGESQGHFGSPVTVVIQP